MSRIASIIAFIVALLGLLVGGFLAFAYWGDFDNASAGEFYTMAAGFAVFGVGLVVSYILRNRAV